MSLKQTHWSFDIETSSKICLLSKTLSCHCSRLTSCTWTNRRIDSLMNRAMRIDESLHWWCHWSRLTDRLAHWRDRLWARHCSRLTSCMWMYDQVHWWVERRERVDHCIENRCHWSRLTENLLIEIETSRSSKLISLIALWNRDFTQFYDWSRLFIKFEEFLCESEWTINSLIFWSSRMISIVCLYSLISARVQIFCLFSLSQLTRKKNECLHDRKSTRSKSIVVWIKQSKSMQIISLRL